MSVGMFPFSSVALPKMSAFRQLHFLPKRSVSSRLFPAHTQQLSNLGASGSQTFLAQHKKLSPITSTTCKINLATCTATLHLYLEVQCHPSISKTWLSILQQYMYHHQTHEWQLQSKAKYVHAWTYAQSRHTKSFFRQIISALGTTSSLQLLWISDFVFELNISQL